MIRVDRTCGKENTWEKRKGSGDPVKETVQQQDTTGNHGNNIRAEKNHTDPRGKRHNSKEQTTGTQGWPV
jgi:hypothetical protein